MLNSATANTIVSHAPGIHVIQQVNRLSTRFSARLIGRQSDSRTAATAATMVVVVVTDALIVHPHDQGSHERQVTACRQLQLVRDVAS